MKQDISVEILSDITVHSKYARYLPEKKRRETWYELVKRNKQMHIDKFPQLKEEIDEAYEYVYQKKVLPSMRSMQFGGTPIEKNPTRIYNCSFLPLDSPIAFAEVMFLLLSGTGVGYSVTQKVIERLPALIGPEKPEEGRSPRRFLIGDSIEGWADAVKVLMESYFEGKRDVEFDYRDIRPKGAELITSGGKAPGPEPLREAIESLRGVLDSAIAERGRGTRIKPIEAHDMACHIADAVLAGGIRRAAMISLFDADDEEMLNAKSGGWWNDNPQRGRANNSALANRETFTKEDFFDLWKAVENSGAGEPGIFFTNDDSGDQGLNPCAEISLNAYQFCNLTEINADDVEDQDDLNQRAKVAAFIGTLQASYTDFHYLRPEWQETTEREALIGVSMTGIASGATFPLDLEEASNVVKEENARVAALIDINEAARTTAIKPAGTTSLTLGTSSGIHAWFDEYYIRRMRIGKNEALYQYLIENHPELVEDEFFRPDTMAVISVPQKAPKGAVLRHETAIDTLERVKRWNLEWVQNGHREGANYNNVSCTINVKDDEWEEVGEWMWENRETYTAISVLPYDGGTYQQAPFETITEEQYNEMMKHLSGIDLTQVVEEVDNTDLQAEAACAGGACDTVDITDADEEGKDIPTLAFDTLSIAG